MNRIFFFLLLCSGFALAQDPVGARRFTNQMVHSSGVNSVAFSPDGKKIVSGSHDGTIKIWSVASGKEIATLKRKGYIVSCVAFSPDGNKIISGIGNKVIIWDVASGNEIATLEGHSSGVTSIAVSHDGTKIASIARLDGFIKIWNAVSGEEITTVEGHYGFSMTFSSDGTKVVSGSYDNTIKIGDASSGINIATLKGHNSGVSSVAFSPDGTKVISGSYDSTIKIWDAVSASEIATLKGHSSIVNSLAFSFDGTKIISGSSDQTIKIWDTASGKEMNTLKGHKSSITSIAFSPDDEKIVSGSYDSSIKIWDTNTGLERRPPSRYFSKVSSVALSPDGKKIISGGMDNRIMLWDKNSGEEITNLLWSKTSLHSYTQSVSLMSNKVIALSYDKKLKTWDAATGNELSEVTHTGYHPTSGTPVAFHPSGTIAVIGGSSDLDSYHANTNSLHIYNISTGKEITALKGHTAPATDVVFSPDGEKVISGSDDNTIKMWNPATGKEIITFNGHTNSVTSVVFSADGKRIASGSRDKTIKIWDAYSGKELISLKILGSHVGKIAFSPDGTKIMSRHDMMVNVWDLKTKEVTKSFELNHTIIQAAFSPSGKSIVIATPAYWIEYLLDKTEEIIEKKETPILTPKSPIYFATHFWNGAETSEISPQRSTHKIVNLSGVWRANFDLSACEVKLFLNGEMVQSGTKSLGSEKKKESEITNTMAIELKEGKNHAQWKLACPNGYETYSATRHLYYDDINQPNLYVYSFGVESIGLKFTQSDARYIQQLFMTQQGQLFKNVFANAYTGTNTEAANIKKTMERISNDSRIRPQDVVLIFFSSHGLPSTDDSFILQAADYDPAAPTHTTLRYREDILTFLEKRPSKRILLLDACFSGSGGKGSPDVSKAIAQTPPGWVLLSSSKGTELSYEHPDWAHGSFTYSLKQALENGKADTDQNGEITLKELYDYLKVAVPAQNRSKKLPAQNPIIKKETIDDDFVIFLKNN